MNEHWVALTRVQFREMKLERDTLQLLGVWARWFQFCGGNGKYFVVYGEDSGYENGGMPEEFK